MSSTIERLRAHGVRPTPQRVAVAEQLFQHGTHPTAEQLFKSARRRSPSLSMATVYNTLYLLVEKGLARQLVLREGLAVFEAESGSHHHFVDDDTGEVVDIPWDRLQVAGVRDLDGLHIREFQVVLRGAKTG